MSSQPSVPSQRRRRALPLAITATIAAFAVMAGLLVPLSAQAAPIGLAGVATNQSGAAVASVAVRAERVDILGTQPLVTTTSATGGFSFPNVPAGIYVLHFAGSATTYPQYLGGGSEAATAQTIGLINGAGNTAWVGASLFASGKITGKVANVTGKAITGYTVQARELDSGDVIASTKTASTGLYSFSGLRPGSYSLKVTDLVSAAPIYAPGFTGNGTYTSIEDAVHVAATKTSTRNFVLSAARTVSGTVTGVHGASLVEKLAGVTVTAFLMYDGFATPIKPTATTRANGTFTLGGLAPGFYTLRFTPPTTAGSSGAVYGAAYLGNSTSLHAAPDFEIEPGSTVSAQNVQLVAAGTVSGVVSTSGNVNTPLANVAVALSYVTDWDDQAAPLFRTVTNSSGAYTFTGVAPGPYVVSYGSHVDSIAGDGITEDLTRVRGSITLAPLTLGENRIQNAYIGAKDPLGLHPLNGNVPNVHAPEWVVGSYATADAGVWNSNGVDVTFQWYRDNVAIAGASGEGHLIAPGDVGHTLHVVATARNFAYGQGRYSSASSPTIGLGAKPVQTAPLTVTGGFELGKTLTVIPPKWNVPGVTASVTWYRTPTDPSAFVPAGTGLTHLISESDAAMSHLWVVVTYNRAGYAPIDSFSTFVGDVIPVPMVPVTKPTATKSGTTLTANPGTWNATPTTLAYTWSITSATGVTSSAAGKTLSLVGKTGASITLTVEASRVGHTNAVKSALVQTGAAPVASGNLSVVGAVKVGSTITAPVPVWSAPQAKFGYAWRYLSGSTWKPVTSGTNGKELTIPANLLGRKLQVLITASTPGFASRVVPSTTTAAVVAASTLYISPAPGSTPTIMGMPAINSTISVTPGTWVESSTGTTYQWRVAKTATGPFTPIAGATKSSYVIPLSLEKKYLVVDVTGNRPGHTPGTVTVIAGLVTAGTLVATKSPVVSHSGSTYAVSKGTWSPAATSHSYAWYAYDLNGQLGAPVATTPTFNTATVPNRRVVVKVTANAAGYSTGTTPAIIAKAGVLTPQLGQPLIVSSAKLGTDFTSPTSSWGPSSTTVAYQWQYKLGTVWKSIVGAIGSTYVPTSATLVGKPVRVVRTGKSTGYTTLSIISPSATVLAGDAAVVGINGSAPSLSGKPRIGQAIVANPGTWSLPGATFGYQWQQAPAGSSTYVAIPGATAASFVIPASLHGHGLRVLISAKIAGRATGTALVDAAMPVTDGSLVSTKAPGVVASGTKLTVSAGTWNATPTSLAYQWEVVERDGSSAVVSSTASYTPVAADAGKFIRATVTAEKAQYFSGSTSVVARAGSAPSPEFWLAGQAWAVVGSTGWVTTGSWNTVGAVTTYQWYRAGVAISGQTGDSYTFTVADVSKVVTVKVTTKAAGYAPFSSVLTYERTVYADWLTSVSAPTIAASSAGARVGTTLTATPGTWNVAGATFSYQWFRGSYQTIPGATAASYVLQAADVNEDLYVVVTARKANYRSARVESNMLVGLSALAIGSSVVPADALKVSGSGALGSALTSSAVKWVGAVSQTYQWMKTVGGVTSPIIGATGKTYTPVATDGLVAGTTVAVAVTATRPGWTTTTVASINSITIK